MKKKVKGVFILEAAIAFPVFIIIFIVLTLNTRIYTVQGFLHTAASSSAQTVNKAVQIINLRNMQSEKGSLPEAKQISAFAAFVASDDLGAYKDEALDLYKQLGKLSADGVCMLLMAVYEKKIHDIMDTYVGEKMTDFTMRPEDIVISGFEINEDEYGKRMDAYITCTLHSPLTFIGDAKRTMHICTYLE